MSRLRGEEFWKKKSHTDRKRKHLGGVDVEQTSIKHQQMTKWGFFAACGASEGKWEALASAGDVSTFIVQCYILLQNIWSKTQFHTNSGTGAMWTATSQWQDAGGGLLRWLLATHGILRFGVLSLLPPSTRHVGNALSLATPDFVWDYQLFLVKKPIYQVIKY